MKRFQPTRRQIDPTGKRSFCRGLALLWFVLSVGAGVANGGESQAHTQQDEAMIRQCLDVARSAMANGNQPFGALLVKDGRVIMRAENTAITGDSIVQHAETNLLSAAYRKLGADGVRGATLYTSSEPCAMCSGAIYLSVVDRVVFGLSSRRLSAMSGFEDDIGAREVFALGKRKVLVTGPVLEDEAAALMAEYLKAHRHGSHGDNARK